MDNYNLIEEFPLDIKEGELPKTLEEYKKSGHELVVFLPINADTYRAVFRKRVTDLDEDKDLVKQIKVGKLLDEMLKAAGNCMSESSTRPASPTALIRLSTSQCVSAAAAVTTAVIIKKPKIT